MELTERPVDESTVVVACSGRLNMVAAPRLTSFIEARLEEGAKRVVVDLAGTGFIDSSGLGALIAALKKTRQIGGDLRIAAPTEQVRTVLGLTNLDRVLRPFDRVEDATDGW